MKRTRKNDKLLQEYWIGRVVALVQEFEVAHSRSMSVDTLKKAVAVLAAEKCRNGQSRPLRPGNASTEYDTTDRRILAESIARHALKKAGLA